MAKYYPVGPMDRETALHILNYMKKVHYKPKINPQNGDDLNKHDREALDYAIAAIEEKEARNG